MPHGLSHPPTPQCHIQPSLRVHLGSPPHQHNWAPAFTLRAPSTSAGCSPKVPSPAKQLLSVTVPLGRSQGEEVFVQAGVTAIACYRPRALLSWQELSGLAVIQRQSCPGKVAADNGGFMDFGGDFVSGNLRGLCCREMLEACCAH